MRRVLCYDLDPKSAQADELEGAWEWAKGRLDASLDLRRGADDAAPLGVALDRVFAAVATTAPDVVLLLCGRRSADQLVRELARPRTPRATMPPTLVVAHALSMAEMAEWSGGAALDFLMPPIRPAELAMRLQRLLGSDAGGLALPTAGSSAATTAAIVGLIGRSPRFLAEVDKIPRMAACDASVLITGETGTGKEVCAKAIHALSARAGKAFVPVNCGALPLDLIENELFGHERGAFTGASTSRPGLIQHADGGTLFLDEVDSLPLQAQVKLLRFLQDRTYRPLGSTRQLTADVRIVSATNVRVVRAVESGRFRQDLFFRLNVIPLRLPPLRERREDIPLLAQHFVEGFARKFGKPVHGLLTDALERLVRYDWPGNVRELEHVLERAVALSGSHRLHSGDIVLGEGEETLDQPFHEAKARVVERFERAYLRALLGLHGGNITRAAEAAGKHRRAFFELLRKYDIDARQFRTVESDSDALAAS